MKKTQIFLLILLFPAWLFAQERVLSGKVIESSGEGLPGASVTIKGTTIGAITDVNGDYRLVVPDGKASSLVFSFIGYIPQEIEIGSNNTS
jgi:TonB-dependent starch-binding outer membrane protein SusC